MPDDQKIQTRDDLPTKPVAVYDGAIAVMGGGEINIQQFHDLCGGMALIAADGGANHAHHYGLELDWIIGDLDSVNPDIMDHAQHVLKISDQYSTDFEKLLASVKADQMLAFGFLGARFDHSLASLHALVSASASASASDGDNQSVVMIGAHDAVKFYQGDFDLVLPPQIRFSLWPLSKQDFKSSQNLRWPLDDITLEMGKMIGTSNETAMSDNNVHVQITAGEGDGYFVMIDAEYASYLI